MNIAGILVHLRPEESDAAAACVGGMDNVEVHARTPDSRMVITVEERDGRVGETLNKIQMLDGVLSAALVYQHGEPDGELEESQDETI